MNGVEHPHSKANIRRHYLKQRRSLARRDVEVYSRLAAQNLCAHSSFQRAHCIHVYATGKDNELDTRPLLEYALKVGKEIYVPTLGSHALIPRPRIEVGQHAMACARIEHIDELNDAHWNIPQPALRTARWLDDWQRIDLTVVPGIAFDRRGQRIGYGAGYYDRLLSHLRARRVGLCFESQLCDDLPADPHDEGMHWIITEQSIYTGETP